jgi:hypothetical protein
VYSVVLVTSCAVVAVPLVALLFLQAFLACKLFFCTEFIQPLLGGIGHRPETLQRQSFRYFWLNSEFGRYFFQNHAQKKLDARI